MCEISAFARDCLVDKYGVSAYGDLELRRNQRVVLGAKRVLVCADLNFVCDVGALFLEQRAN